MAGQVAEKHIGKQLAKKLGYVYVDSGAMYRAITLYFLRNILTGQIKKKYRTL